MQVLCPIIDYLPPGSRIVLLLGYSEPPPIILNDWMHDGARACLGYA